MRTHLILFGLIALIACGGERRRAAAPAARPPASASAPRLGADVRATCAAGARWWRAATVSLDSARVIQVDTVLVPPLGEEAVSTCVVRASVAHDLPGDRPGLRAGYDSVPPVLIHAGGEWRPLLRYVADGPDGNLSGYQQASVRCTVAQSWDGGDDSDSTYIAGDWYEQELTCWAVPGGMESADTTD